MARQAIAFLDTYLKNDEIGSQGLFPDVVDELKLDIQGEREPPNVLIVDPIGRRLGVDTDGNQVNEFGSADVTHTLLRRNQEFSITGQEVSPGVYRATTSSATPDVMTISAKVIGRRGKHAVTYSSSTEFQPSISDEWGFMMPATGTPFADCDLSGALDARDLHCVSSLAARDIVLQELNTLPGDFDGNGDVSFTDFLIMATNFNTSLRAYSDGNADLTGGVEFADFLVLSNNFNKSSPRASTSAPEPAHSYLFFICLFVAVTRSQPGPSLLTSSFSKPADGKYVRRR